MEHYPIMNKEIIEIFAKTDKERFLDCTLGMGGHSYYIMSAFKNTKVVGIDIDSESIDRAKINLEKFGNRIEYYNLNYTEIFRNTELLSKKFSGILVDPGISMYQLKKENRGFSHNINSPLDMRKDRNSENYKETAYDVINSYSESKLSEIFNLYGDIKNARSLSKKIIEKRLFEKIDTTFKLKTLVEKTLGFPQRGRAHPAARVFQALRIYVNGELEGFENFIRKIPEYLKQGGVIFLLTFHSIEDRIVKTTLNLLKEAGKVRILKPFPMVPTNEEIEENSASAPAKLRVAEVL